MKRLFIVSLAALLCAACEKSAEETRPDAPIAQAAEEQAADETDETDETGDAATGADDQAQGAAAKPSGPDTPQALGMGSTPDDIAQGDTNMYGATTFAVEGEPMPLAAAIEKAGANDAPVKVSATIEKVCQKKGCWFTLEADEVAMPIRVKMKDYAFFVPRNAMGMSAVVEGTLEQVTVEQEVAQHYADDEAEATGKPARKVEGPQESYEFTATAIQIANEST